MVGSSMGLKVEALCLEIMEVFVKFWKRFENLGKMRNLERE